MLSGFFYDRQGKEQETGRSRTFWDSNYRIKTHQIPEPDRGRM